MPEVIPDTHKAVAESFNSGSLLFALAIVMTLTLLNAFFALSEIALITLRKTRIRQLVEEGNQNAMLVERLLASPTRLMATIQTGVTLIATFSSAIAATSAVDPLSHWFINHGMSKGTSETVALVSVTLPVAILTLVIGEIAPKSLAVRHPERFALLSCHAIAWLQIVMTPVVVVLTFLSNIVVKPFGGTAHFTASTVNEEEFKILVEEGEEQGVLEKGETEMIHSILDFSDTLVRRVMTTRIDMTAIERGCSLKEIVAKISTSGHSRIPLYEGDLDNILGIIHAKDLLNLPFDVSLEAVPLSNVIRAPFFIPEQKKVGELLRDFQKTKQQIAIVRDEYGVTAGLITIEDLLEQIVGEIHDEYDVEESMLQVIDSHTSIINGMMMLEEVNDRMGLELPIGDADTLGGFVFSKLGHQALHNEEVVWEKSRFIVEATDGKRITKVRLVREDANSDSRIPAPSAEENFDSDSQPRSSKALT